MGCRWPRNWFALDRGSGSFVMHGKEYLAAVRCQAIHNTGV
jgi:hypothetical protein